MPSGIPTEPPSPWREFLRQLDAALPGPSLPDGYAERVTPLFPGAYRHLQLHAHDLALSKLSRNSPVDREDVAFLARTVPLDAGLLRTRYRHELRPIAIGPLERLDEVLELWIEAYFSAP